MKPQSFLPYLRIQTIALAGWWAGLMFLEWAKPGVVSNAVNPQWVLMAAAASATIMALWRPAKTAAGDFLHRRAVAVVIALLLGLSVAWRASADFGLLIGLVAGASLVAALGAPGDYD